MSRVIRLGTRRSPLAMAQTRLVAERIEKEIADVQIELIPITTKGDRILDRPLLEFGGKGVFVDEFERALVEKSIDLAVHSAKDMPGELSEGLSLLCLTDREDPRDVLVTRKGFPLSDVKIAGTGSKRRSLQLEKLSREGKLGLTESLSCRNLRGNVQTRLEKLAACEYDGIILAAAGLKRLGLLAGGEYDFHFFSLEEMIPAGGQGIIAVEGRKGEPLWKELLALEKKEEALCLRGERHFLNLLGAGCHEPAGVFFQCGEKGLEGIGVYGDEKKTAWARGRNENFDELALAGELALQIKRGQEG